MSYHIIRKIRLAHCKRGPSRCEKCREMDIGKVCLLDVGFSDEGKQQRRVVQVTIDGEEIWREFEIVKVFETRGEAEKYAAENGIKDVEY